MHDAHTDLSPVKPGDELLEIWRHKMLPILLAKGNEVTTYGYFDFVKVVSAVGLMIETLAGWKDKEHAS